MTGYDAPEPNVDVRAAYDAALGSPLAAWREETVARVRGGWLGGVAIYTIARENALHWREVMEIVRLLKLPERCPATLAPVPIPSPPAPLSPELLAH